MQQTPHRIAAALTLAGLTHAASGQAIFVENFAGETISSLESQGWMFRNQSDNPYQAPWEIPTGYNGPDGSTYLKSDSWAFHTGAGKSSVWAILPAIPQLGAGDELKFHAAMWWGPQRSDVLEVRLSPSGGTSTGSTSTDLGDFTEVLWSRAGNDLGPWAQQQLILPGGGRLALRYAWSNTSSGYSGAVNVDAIIINPAAPSGPPIPVPGQTVHWTLAMSPITFNAGDVVIPEGGTVIVDPGVTININTPARLIVHGQFDAHGTAAQPVTLNGASSGIFVSGESEIAHATVACRVVPEGKSGGILITDSTLTAASRVDLGSYSAFLSLTRCSIDTPQFAPFGQIAVRDCTYSGDRFATGDYALIDGLTSTAPVELIREAQPMYVDNIHISGVNGPAITLLSSGFSAADFFFGAGNTLVNNLYPVKIHTAGIVPGSTIPVTGNTNNAVELHNSGGGARYNTVHLPKLDVPYHLLTSTDGFMQGRLEIEPGTTFKVAPTSGIYFLAGQDGYMLKGTPAEPIRFEPLTPGQRWYGLSLDQGHNFLEHITLDGSGIGGLEGYHHIRDSVITNAEYGLYPSEAFFWVRGTKFLDCDIGVEEDNSPFSVGLDLNGVQRPNSFSGNTIAVNAIISGGWDPIPAMHNWWGDPSGPSNVPGPSGGGYFGSGDPVTSNVQANPFLTAEPDYSDKPPTINFVTRPYPAALPGEKIFLEWEASDDVEIVSQEIQFNDGSFEFFPFIQNIPGDQRRIELIVPTTLAGTGGRDSTSRIRIIARDSAGNESMDQFELRIPHYQTTGTVTFQTSLAPGVRSGERIEIDYLAYPTPNWYPGSIGIYIDLSADERWYKGPNGTLSGSISDLRIPRVSTDRARLAIDLSGGNNIEWKFSPYFSIRPDARLGDAPPTVDMTAPAAGAQFQGGSIIPIAWTASDDEGLRAFKIQASYNGGRTWHLVRELPGIARAFSWQLPTSTGIDNLRIRVTAIDHRFQNSASGDDRPFVITPGNEPPACYANCDGSATAPILNIADFSCFLTRFAAGDAYANCDQSTTAPVLNIADFSCFLVKFAAGCD